ncbi:hypothetical protein QR721_10820 [Aciduricibacillus chroicocephali]|uniref:Prepilin-type N-terminal cleavage/methylation domain-containing protein n=1 Tax=Aciduricibacillus chroicocephali TaxID=3054939 RepID=A0ABY9KTH3_9BACI|nr:hypothetical protein QR721_10820 [Bacillaceae bacterium 44XB]
MLNDEKGLSLVEILAGIVLLGIITTLTTIILTNSFDRKETAGKQISLTQETNEMISSLRNEYFREENINNYKNNQKVCFNKGNLDIDLEKTNKSILEGPYPNGEFEQLEDNICLTNFDYSEPVEFTLYTYNDKKELHVSSLLPRRIQIGSESNTLAGCAIKLNKPTVYDTLPCTAKGDTIWTGKRTSCKETVIQGNLLSKGALDESSLDDKTLYVSKNACFANSIQPRNAKIEIKRNAEFTNQVEFEIGSTLTVRHNAKFSNQQTQFYDDSTFKIYGDVIFEKGLQTQASVLKNLYIKGDATFSGPFQLKNFTQLQIDGFVTFNEIVELQNQSALNIKKHTLFNKETDINKSSVLIDSSLDSLSGKFHLSNGSILKANGDARLKTSSLQISDDSIFCARSIDTGKYQGKVNISNKCN